MSGKKWLNRDQACVYLGVKRSTIYSMISDRMIPHYRIGAKLRFEQSELDSWIEGTRVQTKDEYLQEQLKR